MIVRRFLAAVSLLTQFLFHHIELFLLDVVVIFDFYFSVKIIIMKSILLGGIYIYI